ncbi:M28 family peptidase [Granulicella tundricola]|uniref:Carboxypeptidase Q n=1 Tax=Granulicella tundricola (strain ATCC BAA-1859 / DSM 23138 / MP5ACTX9) TaxID=1198114 RepID=E8X255_GRATM|nr:M28 family peptidase [Granulicella tundricola]ADW70298.1 peptidase M28 [Granulicella tundricola MP5ACTX9]
MNRSLLRPAAAIATALFLLSSAPAQEQAGDKVDLDVLAKIKSQAYDHSQVMENLYSISEVYGPRVNNSRNHRAAAEWAVTQLKAWGLQNVHLEKFDFGYGWQIKKFYAAMEAPAYAALIGFPLAWTPGTNGPITADAMYAPIHSKDDFAKYHGKLKGKIVLMFDPPHLLLHTTQDATKSPTDEEILARANAPRGGAAPAGRGAAPGGPTPRGRGRVDEGTWEYTPTSLALADEKNHDLRNEINAYLHDEAPAVVLTPGYNGDGGTIFSSYGGSQDPKDPVPPPIVAITPEQYNRIVRLLQHGTTPKLTFDVAVDYQKDDQRAYNVIGEIPGTTKKDEVVMLGGHFDSWQGGTGATDNGTGSSVAMEAVRILTTLHQPMARTVRVALWGGEEEGEWGSKAYVQQHFAPRDTMKQTPDYAKLDVYFNDDGGSGRFRGVSAGGSPQMAAIFKSWIEPIKDQHIVAVSNADTFRPTLTPGGTDSSAFSWIGLNGIGFQQDGLEYGTRTHQSNMDLYDRVQQDDVMQGSMIEAWFTYNAATRAEMLPRIPTPEPLKK